jgi:hypothetical protein
MHSAFHASAPSNAPFLRLFSHINAGFQRTCKQTDDLHTAQRTHLDGDELIGDWTVSWTSAVPSLPCPALSLIARLLICATAATTRISGCTRQIS